MNDVYCETFEALYLYIYNNIYLKDRLTFIKKRIIIEIS